MGVLNYIVLYIKHIYDLQQCNDLTKVLLVNVRSHALWRDCLVLSLPNTLYKYFYFVYFFVLRNGLNTYYKTSRPLFPTDTGFILSVPKYA